MNNQYRTHTCGELNIKNVGEEVRLAGWVQRIRNLGGMKFIDLRDQYGITQSVVTVESGLIDMASKIPNESTISIEGTVRLRDEETINPKITTGEVEVVAEKIEILFFSFSLVFSSFL